MRSRTFVPALVLLAACASEPPPAAPTAPAPPPPPVASSASPPPAPATAASSDPTVLTGDQQRRDAARAPLATSIVDAYSNWDGFFSSLVANYAPDGKHVVFGSVRDGLPEIYLGEVAHPDAPAKAVTTGPERAIWAAFTPDGKSILFLRDEKGDENQAIWKVGVDGSGLTNLTPGDKLHRGEPFFVRASPKTIVYDASRTTALGCTVFTQSLDGGAPKSVYTDPGVSGLADVAPDGAHALFLRAPSQNDQRLLVLDLKTGAPRPFYPPEGKAVAIHSAAFSEDGKRVFVSTDEGAESSVLLALDAATGKELGRYVNDPPTAAMRVAVAPKGERLAVRSDLGNHGDIRILDAKTLKPQKSVKLPLGDVLLGTFAKDGKSVSALISLPDQPADVFSVDVATGDVHPLRSDKRAGLDALPPMETQIENVKAFDGLTIPINRYLPKLAAQKKLPTVVIFHGGPSTSYAVRWNPYARFFLSLGYAVLEPNVRGSSGFGRAYEMADNREKRADWLKDLESVNAWVRAQPWADPDRVIVWGQSYGGYTTLMAMTRQPNLWRAGVDLYGPADMKAFLKTTDAAIRSFFVAEFGDVEKDGDLLDKFSPMRDVGEIKRPLFVYSGQNDPRVPRSESDTIVKALRTRGVPVEYMVAANEGHTVDRRTTKIELLTRTARFLEDALSDTSASPATPH
ncbi:MAG TPA: prolyl oligopeptidase family serine peptidase [Polyangiaceae bacterium]|jgi:dipeptidyl aminopeptidase/acylaminoacyl peptidase